MSNLKSSLAVVMLTGALWGGCAAPSTGPSSGQAYTAPVDFSGEWTLSRDEFARGELDGLRVDDGTLHLSGERQQGAFISRPFDTGATFDALTFSADAGPLSAPGQPPPACEPRFTLQARTSANGQTWSTWTTLDPDESDDSKDDDPAGDQHIVGQIVPVTAGRYLQVWLILLESPSQCQPAVRSISVAYVYAAAGPTMVQAKAAALPAQPEPGAPRPVIIPRAGWGAKQSLMTWKSEYSQPLRVVIHHTVTPNNEDNPAATVRSIYYFHAITRKWGDIGYNYLIDWQGNVYEGRAGGETVVGGHARGYNEGSVGIALMGTYTRQDITPAMRTSLVALLAWVSARYGIDPQGRSSVYGRSLPNILGHRVVAKTNCPGDVVYAQLDDLRAEVAGVVDRYGGIAAVTATPAPTQTRLRTTATPALATPTAQPGITATGPASVEAQITPTLSTVEPATPTPEPTQAPETATPEPSRIVLTGIEVGPYPLAAGRPLDVVIHLTNTGPAELTQVSVQLLLDIETTASGQTGLAWQLGRLRAGQATTLSSHALSLETGLHRLSVRATGRDETGRVLASEWGPLAVSVGPSDETAPVTGWRGVVRRWSIGLGQAWKEIQEFVNRNLALSR